MKTSALSFSLIIPNYNGAKYLPACLESIVSAINNCPDSKFEIILVDNASTDNSLDLFNNFFKNSKFNIPHSTFKFNFNHGFASPVNKGISIAQYDWVVVVNNDLKLDKFWFKLTEKEISNNNNPHLAAVCGTVLSYDGTKIESQGLDFNYIGKCTNISNSLPFPQSKIYDLNPSYIWGSPAALVVYKKNIVNTVGAFDEDFFAYEEDVDLALRLHKLGFRTLYIPSALSYHLGGATSSKMGNFRSKHDFKNWIYIIIKNYSAKDFWSNFPEIIIERFRNISGLFKNTYKSYGWKCLYIFPKDVFLLKLEIIHHVPSMLRKRTIIKSLQYN